MGSVKDYFSSLGTGIASLLKGMQVTGKELVTRKITEEYPDNRLDGPAAPRFRAELRLKYDAEGNHKCIACGTCERNCPNGTIKIESKMVDTLAGNADRLREYGRRFEAFRQAVRQLKKAKARLERVRDDEEFTRYQLQQLDEARLQSGELEQLEKDREVLGNLTAVKSDSTMPSRRSPTARPTP